MHDIYFFNFVHLRLPFEYEAERAPFSEPEVLPSLFLSCFREVYSKTNFEGKCEFLQRRLPRPLVWSRRDGCCLAWRNQLQREYSPALDCFLALSCAGCTSVGMRGLIFAQFAHSFFAVFADENHCSDVRIGWSLFRQFCFWTPDVFSRFPSLSSCAR